MNEKVSTLNSRVAYYIQCSCIYMYISSMYNNIHVQAIYSQDWLPTPPDTHTSSADTTLGPSTVQGSMSGTPVRPTNMHVSQHKVKRTLELPASSKVTFT